MIDDIRAEMEAAVAAGDEAAPSQDIETPSEDTASPEPDPTPASVDPPTSDPAPVAATDTPKPKAGPIPFERHEAVLANARREAAEQAEAKYRWVQSYGDPQQVQSKLALLQQADNDPAGVIRMIAAAANLDPASAFAPPASARPPEPPAPDIHLEDGRRTYSDGQLAKLLDWQREQVTQQVQAEVAPLKQSALVAELKERSVVNARQQLSVASQWPGFQDHKAAIVDAMKANAQLTLHEAYIQAAVPKIAERAKTAETTAYQKALADMQAKAGAATPLAPRTGAVAATPPDFSKMSMLESIRAGMEMSLRGEL